jgi:ATP-dependent DNA helicase RecG
VFGIFAEELLKSRQQFVHLQTAIRLHVPFCFLKLTEGRGTGVPKIRYKLKQNGSPDPGFDFDEARSYFTAILPAHPQYIVIHGLRESAHLWAIGERRRAIRALEAAVTSVPASGMLLAQLIQYRTDAGDLAGARQFFSTVESKPELADALLPFLAMAKALLDHGQTEAAAAILANASAPSNPDVAAELAALRNRLAS